MNHALVTAHHVTSVTALVKAKHQMCRIICIQIAFSDVLIYNIKPYTVLKHKEHHSGL